MDRLILLGLLCFLCLDGAYAQTEDAVATTTPISVNGPNSDTQIAERIASIFEAVGGFEDIVVSVDSGVVTLGGTASNANARADAISIANRTEGVVLSLDRMSEATELESQLAPAIQKLREMGRVLVVKLPLIGAAIILLLISWHVARWVGNRKTWLVRLQVSSLGKQLILRVARFAILAIGVLLALELLDATAIVGAVIGAAGLAGLALGFAFKSIVENYLAGVLLSTRNPFEIGDAVEIDGRTGKVARLTARDTVLVTPDGNHLRIPNALVMNSVLLNFSRNPQRRLEFSVGVSTEFDLTEAKRIGLETLETHPALLGDPAPRCVIDSLGDSSVVMRFFAWIDQEEYDFLMSRSEAIRRVKEAFDEAGIEMPEPIYRVHLREGGSSMSSSDGTIGTLIDGDRGNEESKKAKSPIETEELRVDRTIDEQIEQESESNEENLLPDKSD